MNVTFVRRTGPFALSFIFAAIALHGCFIDNPTAVATTGGPSDAGSDAAIDAGPSICSLHGDYHGIETIVDAFVAKVEADCRINPFFVKLPPDRQLHLHDCLVKQLAVITKCKDIRYDVDNNGIACRDMKTAHMGLAIREADFDALVDDLLDALKEGGLSQAELDSFGPIIDSLEYDIITNSAPDFSKNVCDAGAGDGG